MVAIQGDEHADRRAALDFDAWICEVAITLLDVVVFDQERHRWSLHELVHGNRSVAGTERRPSCAYSPS